MSKWLNSLQPWGALLLRLVLGVPLSIHGYEKVVPHGALAHFCHYVVTLGLPYWLGYVSAFTELIGGACLILGLLTRLAAALVAINMLVALFKIGIHEQLDGWSYIAALAAIAIMLILYGAGKLALDRKIGFA
jgi:putative oxidoreductase